MYNQRERGGAAPPSMAGMVPTSSGITPTASMQVLAGMPGSMNGGLSSNMSHQMTTSMAQTMNSQMQLQHQQQNSNSGHLGQLSQKLASFNEQTWLQLGALSELLLDPERAVSSYENALRHNRYSVKALTQIASLCRIRENFPKAVEYFQRILTIESNNGEIWGALGHCYLMLDDLQKAYGAYQQALYHLPNPKDPKLWYGIGILYDRYGSYEHAEEAFTAVLKMDLKFEKANEIYFRLGIIYKQQQKYDTSLECFRYIRANPPPPLTEGDIWFQIGHVYEQQKEFVFAKEAYEKVLKENPNHAKVLQQLGWLFHQPSTFMDQNIAINYLSRSLELDQNDTQTWYLLGRLYMSQQKYNKAYECYQQAVYRDGRNPNFWCSIGVLYFQINQYRDALDAYSRAIRLNPCISEVWFDLGTLYEACNQINDALDAYQRAAELDTNNAQIKQRLHVLRQAQATGRLPANQPAPLPADGALNGPAPPGTMHSSNTSVASKLNNDGTTIPPVQLDGDRKNLPTLPSVDSSRLSPNNLMLRPVSSVKFEPNAGEDKKNDLTKIKTDAEMDTVATLRSLSALSEAASAAPIPTPISSSSSSSSPTADTVPTPVSPESKQEQTEAKGSKRAAEDSDSEQSKRTKPSEDVVPSEPEPPATVKPEEKKEKLVETPVEKAESSSSVVTAAESESS